MKHSYYSSRTSAEVTLFFSSNWHYFSSCSQSPHPIVSSISFFFPPSFLLYWLRLQKHSPSLSLRQPLSVHLCTISQIESDLSGLPYRPGNKSCVGNASDWFAYRLPRHSSHGNSVPTAGNYAIMMPNVHYAQPPLIAKEAMPTPTSGVTDMHFSVRHHFVLY